MKSKHIRFDHLLCLPWCFPVISLQTVLQEWAECASSQCVFMTALINTLLLFEVCLGRYKSGDYVGLQLKLHFTLEYRGDRRQQDTEVSSKSVEHLLLLSELQVHRNSPCH